MDKSSASDESVYSFELSNICTSDEELSEEDWDSEKELVTPKRRKSKSQNSSGNSQKPRSARSSSSHHSSSSKHTHSPSSSEEDEPSEEELEKNTGDTWHSNTNPPTKMSAARRSRSNDDDSDHEDSSPEVQKLRAQVATLQAEKARDSGKRRKKQNTKEENNELFQLIRKTFKEKMWRTVKFLTSPQQKKTFVTKFLKELKLAGHDPENDADKRRVRKFFKEWEDIMIQVMNEFRDTVNGAIKAECFKWMSENDGKLPKTGTILQCTTRKIDLTKEGHQEIWLWYLDVLLPKAAGNLRDWALDKRGYHTISTAAPQENPKAFYMQPSTEAFLLAAYQGNHAKWEAMYALKKSHPTKRMTIIHKVPQEKLDAKVKYEVKGNQLLLYDKKYQGKYTKSNAGQQEKGGWTEEGIGQWMKYRDANKAARLTPESRKLEQEGMNLIKLEHGLVAASYEEEANNKKKTTARKELITKEFDVFGDEE